MRESIEMAWNGFIQHACNSYPEEACALLYARTPFKEGEEWHVFPVPNSAPDKERGWTFDKKQMKKIKRAAKKEQLTRIGNIHSHPIPKEHSQLTVTEQEAIIDHINQPSERDIKYAQRFNDIVRGILVVGKDAVYAHCFHDQFGTIIEDIYLEGINKRTIQMDILKK